MSDNRRIYTFGKSKLTVEIGDITTSSAQVIVSSDDYYITMGGGVSAAIRRAGGKAIELDVSKKVPASLGDVVVSTAGSLQAQYIFHVITDDNVKKEILYARFLGEIKRNVVQIKKGRAFERNKSVRTGKYSRALRRSL